MSHLVFMHLSLKQINATKWQHYLDRERSKRSEETACGHPLYRRRRCLQGSDRHGLFSRCQAAHGWGRVVGEGKTGRKAFRGIRLA